MALKNFSKVELKKNNKTYWVLFDSQGDDVFMFSEWTLFIQNKFAFETRNKYAQVVSKFLDFLVEVGVYENTITRLEFKQVIEDYKSLLSFGKSISDKNLKTIAEELSFNKIASSSWSNNLSAINSFLGFVFEKEKDERDYLAVKNNIILSENYVDLLKDITSVKSLNSFQKKALKQKSCIANIYRTNGDIKVSSGITRNSRVNNINNDIMDFPAIEMPNLLINATSYRDRAIYALLAGTGVRSSEAISLEWSDIDIENQKVYIKYKGDNENLRFKGRRTEETFFIPELKVIFFDALFKYQLKESNKNVSHNFVFQFLERKRYGLPYCNVSRQIFIKNFKKTVARIGNEQLNHFTPHSLRHFYGVYMLNHIPNDNGGCGLSIEMVQTMMGHNSIINTQKYARREQDYIRKQLLFAEMSMNYDVSNIKDLNKLIENNYKEVLKND